MNSGWIKLHRKFLDWEWADCPKTSHLFIHLLVMANHEDKKWRGKLIKRGELITSYSKLKEQTGLSIKSLRVAFRHLEKTKEVARLRASKGQSNYTHVSINNYDEYQEKGKEKGKLGATNKNDKKNKKEGSRKILLEKNLHKELAEELELSEKTVADTAQIVLDYCKSKGRVYKDYKATLRNWLKREIKSGGISKLSPQMVAYYKATGRWQ